MKFSAAAVLAAVTSASAWGNVSYTTEVVTALTTYCPESTVLTHAGTTYTISTATTLTITDCPCTITKPVTTQTSVACSTCVAPSSPSYPNGTVPVPAPTSAPAGTGGVIITPTHTAPGGDTPTSSPIATAGAGKAVALSGAGLAGVMGVAAFFL